LGSATAEEAEGNKWRTAGGREVAVSGAPPETSNVVGRFLSQSVLLKARTSTFGVPGGAPATATEAVALRALMKP
jgi:hypothetical protein